MTTDATRVALVTGGAVGIGLSIARVLVEEGHAMTIVDRDEHRLNAATHDLRSRGARVLAIVADLRHEPEIVDAVARHSESYGRLDVLVNNAGVSIAQPVEEITAKRLDLQIAVNLSATVLFYRECFELLRAAGAEHGNAVVVNLASISAKAGVARMGAYSAAKAGVVAWTEAMNRELADYGVKSTVLCPAATDTPMTDAVKHLVPGETMIRPEDVAEAVRFLLRTSAYCVIPELVLTRPGETTERSVL